MKTFFRLQYLSRFGWVDWDENPYPSWEEYELAHARERLEKARAIYTRIKFRLVKRKVTESVVE